MFFKKVPLFLIIIIFALSSCSKEQHPLSGKWESSSSGLSIEINTVKNTIEYINSPNDWISFEIKNITTELVKGEKNNIPLTVFEMKLKQITSKTPKNLTPGEIKQFKKETNNFSKKFKGNKCIMKIYSSNNKVIYAQITHPLNYKKGFSDWLEFDLIKKIS
jgi:hypothetical protein